MGSEDKGVCIVQTIRLVAWVSQIEKIISKLKKLEAIPGAKSKRIDLIEPKHKQ
jgi:hypothetical protein